ncbi:hypothetical protein FNH05_14830 [Amycolatopsis rhizosphaerae]|uniref:Right-handed parallel beta-helix repeat-containing protein n=1 Tax=Amycolatopsis rhizosphaerae TaxID=2053003 RepID=A0A558CRS6_9PSEU|nr:hypothetical protein [Amycolatopsis rhizosphaerae]TVT51469.1 hypothetical protein FNH05_14830 [Amycolatopsis rhizosphaerae]
MLRRKRLTLVLTAALVVIAGVLALVLWPAGGPSHGRQQRPWALPQAPPLIPVSLPVPDTRADNRRAPVPGLPDWSKAGYRQGAGLPADADFNPDPRCRITPAVTPDDGRDDTEALQAAIDRIRRDCSPTASYNRLSLITLPAGVLDVTRQISIDANYLVIRGQGADPATGTRFVFHPDDNTRYDVLTKDGGTWDQDGMDSGDGSGGWLWPGRGLFRVQSRQVDPSYRKDYASAPANRKDLFEGTVNAHWKAGVKLREKPGDHGFAARTGDTVVPLAEGASLEHFAPGGYVNIRAANSMAFYQQQQALPTDQELQNQHMRQQIFTIAAVNPAEHTITLDKPLEFDVPVNSVSDGSAKIGGKVYDSKAAPLVDPVVGVGLENFHISQDVAEADPARTTHNYGNTAPADALNGIVLKWTVNSWVRGIGTYLTGSHPIVTEEAKNIEIVGNNLNGAWNKGKGGNGYFRGSRVWDSLYAGNVTRNLRHFTFQWSSSDNVVIGNDFDNDLNLHGGWERRNLFERNTVRVPYEHRPGNCTTNCGDEGGSGPDDSAWFPIWWGAGAKAVKWSGATGPQNVFFGNTMSKQLVPGGPGVAFYPDPHRIYQFGWDGAAYRPLSENGTPIRDWAGHEQDDFTHGDGVDASRTDPADSLFLKN